MVDTTGQVNLRAETIDTIVKGFALQEYKFKQVCAQSSSSSWKESYYQEGATELAGGTGSAIKGVPRLAQFPYGEPNWTKQSSYLEKYGFEGVVSYEDQKTDTIDVISRTLLRISRAVAKAVDDQIFTVIAEVVSGVYTPTNIQSINIAAGREWSQPTNTTTGLISGANIIDDLLNAKQKIYEYNYNPEGAYVLVSPKDYRSINQWLANKGAQFPAMGNSIASNGRAGTIVGLNIIVSNSVTASGALVIVGNEAATWKSAVPLTTKTIEDPGIKTTIRAWEIGVTQLVNPKAICLIRNTQHAA